MRGDHWEDGTIVLPSADFSKVRQAVERAEKDHRQRIFGLTQECWFGMTRHEQDRPDEYDSAVASFISAKRSANLRTGSLVGHSLGAHTESVDPWLDEAIREAKLLLARGPGKLKPARIQKGDMEFPTNRTTYFVACEAEISFDRDERAVSWAVSSRNFPLSMSSSHPAAAVLMAELANVRWTDGTGGGIENAQGVKIAYGPLGAEAAPHRCLPYRTSRGKEVTQSDLERLILRQTRRAA